MLSDTDTVELSPNLTGHERERNLKRCWYRDWCRWNHAIVLGSEQGLGEMLLKGHEGKHHTFANFTKGWRVGGYVGVGLNTITNLLTMHYGRSYGNLGSWSSLVNDMKGGNMMHAAKKMIANPLVLTNLLMCHQLQAYLQHWYIKTDLKDHFKGSHSTRYGDHHPSWRCCTPCRHLYR